MHCNGQRGVVYPRTILVGLLFGIVLLSPTESRTASETAPASGAGDPATTVGTQDSAGGSDLEPQLQQARECLKNGDYEQAIDLLRAAIQRARNRLPELRESYLLLIKTYVLRGNEFKLEIQGRSTSELYYQQARQLIAECLRTEELRHTRPVPEAEYPPEMATLFEETRHQIFGSLRIVNLKPVDSLVFLDGDSLRTPAGDSLPGDTDLAAGPHLLTVMRPGYRTLSQQVTLSPGSVQDLPVQLSKSRNVSWYAWRGGVVGGAITAVFVAILRGNDSGSAGPEALPEPPVPPSH